MPTPTWAGRPGPDDRDGVGFEGGGRVVCSVLTALDAPRNAEAYLCGPAAVMQEMSAGLAAVGPAAPRNHTAPWRPATASRPHSAPFGPAPGRAPGSSAAPARAPHPPGGQPGNGPTIEFARSDL